MSRGGEGVKQPERYQPKLKTLPPHLNCSCERAHALRDLGARRRAQDLLEAVRERGDHARLVRDLEEQRLELVSVPTAV